MNPKIKAVLLFLGAVVFLASSVYLSYKVMFHVELITGNDVIGVVSCAAVAAFMAFNAKEAWKVQVKI